MNEEILVNTTAHETRIAVIQQGAVQELHIERAATRGLVGNVYLGRVSRVLPGMQSAFVDIGLERAAFLHVADLWQSRAGNHHAHPMPIEKVLFEGQPLLVQVIKDPLGTKGARLSSQISIAGRLLVYLPQDPHIGVSQRIGDESERTQLRQRLQRLLPNGERGGFIIRTSAEDAGDEELTADIDYLRKRWAQILEGSKERPAASLLYHELSLTQRMLRDVASESTTAILVDSRDEMASLAEFAGTYMPGIAGRMRLYTSHRPLFELHGVEHEIEKALARRVDLKSGGYLIIDQTEALTTIDVNTGGYIGGRSFDDTIFKTNLEAAHAIARQLRVRNLGGIIIVDFIDMGSHDHRDAVLAELRKALSRDRTKTSVNGFTALGLIEMTRKRTRESLAHILCEPCETCGGKGTTKTARTVCYEILREIQREAKQFNPREFRIVASQEVIDLFLEEEAQPLATLGDAIGKKIALQVETVYGQEQYDIVLM
ncbi:MAG TPA: ribonuclease G [Burkholderiaceae bacterium]|nr:ribonuclease G [Burkholderiaceae bacterium]